MKTEETETLAPRELVPSYIEGIEGFSLRFPSLVKVEQE